MSLCGRCLMMLDNLFATCNRCLEELLYNSNTCSDCGCEIDKDKQKCHMCEKEKESKRIQVYFADSEKAHCKLVIDGNGVKTNGIEIYTGLKECLINYGFELEVRNFKKVNTCQSCGCELDEEERIGLCDICLEQRR